jgi:hypothetical protein
VIAPRFSCSTQYPKRFNHVALSWGSEPIYSGDRSEAVSMLKYFIFLKQKIPCLGTVKISQMKGFVQGQGIKVKFHFIRLFTASCV